MQINTSVDLSQPTITDLPVPFLGTGRNSQWPRI